MNFGLGYLNWLHYITPTYSGGSWALGLAHLSTWPLADTARSTNASSGSTIIQIDWGQAVAAQLFTVPRHNCSSAATVRWKRSNVSLGGTDIIDSGTQNVWNFAPRVYRGDVYDVQVLQASETSARYEQIEFVDTSNPDGWLEFGRLGFYPMLAPAVWQSYGAKDGHDDMSVVSFARGGAPWPDKQRRPRTTNFMLDRLTLAEGAILHEMEDEIGTTAEVYYLPYADSAADRQRYGFTGMMRELSGIEYPYFNTRRRAFNLTQRL